MILTFSFTSLDSSGLMMGQAMWVSAYGALMMSMLRAVVCLVG